MAGPRLPNHKNTSTSEDRFARRDFRKYSGWSSAAVITATVIIVGIVFIYLAMHSGFQSNSRRVNHFRKVTHRQKLVGCPVRRARAAIADQHRRRNARGAQAAGA